MHTASWKHCCSDATTNIMLQQRYATYNIVVRDATTNIMLQQRYATYNIVVRDAITDTTTDTQLHRNSVVGCYKFSCNPE